MTTDLLKSVSEAIHWHCVVARRGMNRNPDLHRNRMPISPVLATRWQAERPAYHAWTRRPPNECARKCDSV
ncbi:hypothetical protein PSAC2689_20239 [Paraburkholderia sacchari]